MKPFIAQETDGSRWVQLEDYEKLEAQLSECALAFRDYEQQHMNKGTSDGIRKATVNAELARKCEALL